MAEVGKMPEEVGKKPSLSLYEAFADGRRVHVLTLNHFPVMEVDGDLKSAVVMEKAEMMMLARELWKASGCRTGPRRTE